MKSLADIDPYKYMYVDGMNFCSRSHYAMRDLSYNGRKTGMLYGVTRLVMDWYYRNRNIKITFVWEGRNSWRKKEYPIYKSNRKSSGTPDEDFMPSVDAVRYALPAMGVDQVYADTYEADDTVYAISALTDKKKLFVSNDWDWWPLIYQGDMLYGKAILNHEDMQERFAKKFNCEKIDMSRLWLFKVLTGDPSDGVPGIPKFRKKIASELANDPYVTIDNIPAQLRSRGYDRWAEVVEDNLDTLTRNHILLLPRIPRFEDLVITHGNYSEEGFEQVLLKSGMADMFERLPRGKKWT